MGKYLDIAQRDGRCEKSVMTSLPPGSLPPADSAPVLMFTEDRERFLVDFYCSRPRAERLVMHRRGQELRRVHPAWPGDACDLQAMEDHFAEHPAEPPFVMARDGITFTHTGGKGPTA